MISAIGSGLISSELGVYVFQRMGSAGSMALVTLNDDPAANGVLRCNLVDPFAELDGALGIDPEADRDDHL